jgi:Tetracyclin repressor-like, C-terminal domain
MDSAEALHVVRAFRSLVHGLVALETAEALPPDPIPPEERCRSTVAWLAEPF